MTPSDLITRLSEADSPSRELDKAIVLFLYPNASIQPYCADLDVPTVFHAEPLIDNKGDLPRFTESLDAALTLVPPTHIAESMICDVDEKDCWTAELIEKALSVTNTGLGAYHKRELAAHRNLAMALCIAALKSRSYQEREG